MEKEQNVISGDSGTINARPQSCQNSHSETVMSSGGTGADSASKFKRPFMLFMFLFVC